MVSASSTLSARFDPPPPWQVRAATSLLAITHSLKLLLLLSDEQQIAARRDAAAAEFRERIEKDRQAVAEALDALLNRPNE
jgi:mediator of RNA polymerase II transcription subunit 22